MPESGTTWALQAGWRAPTPPCPAAAEHYSTPCAYPCRIDAVFFRLAPPAPIQHEASRSMTLKIGIIRESRPGEQRVALDPDTAKKLVARGHEVLVQNSARVSAGHHEAAWAGCRMVTNRAALAAGCTV